MFEILKNVKNCSLEKKVHVLKIMFKLSKFMSKEFKTKDDILRIPRLIPFHGMVSGMKAPRSA